MLTPTPNRWRNSASVASGSSRTNSRTRASCGARTTGRPMLGGRRASDPVARRRCLSRRTQDWLTEYFWATAGVFIPAWQSDHTRSRRSSEYARIGTTLSSTDANFRGAKHLDFQAFPHAECFSGHPGKRVRYPTTDGNLKNQGDSAIQSHGNWHQSNSGGSLRATRTPDLALHIS